MINKLSANPISLIFTWLMLMFSSGTLHAEMNASTHISSPDTIPGSTKITADLLIKLIENTPDIVVIDSRLNDRPIGYIEGSLNLPDTKTDCNSLSQIIKAKSNSSVFYCNGPKCGRSAKAVKIALSCGYKNVYWYRDGFNDWLSKGYPYITLD